MLTLEHILGMRAPLRLAAMAAITSILFAHPSLQQTYSTCNPTVQQCPADAALGTSMSADFTKGASDQFTAQGNPTYGSDGVSFTVAQSGDAPQLTSKWYIMFGHVEVVMKAAPGAGIVSSSVLQSDDLDEIDWEWLGAQNNQVQSNYFGKGQTTTYDRAAVHSVTDTQTTFHKYTVDWTENQIVWQIDGTTVRVLTANNANGQYPQTPMQFKLGAWSGGDPSNPQGTVAWAQGPTDYSAGPFSMVVNSVQVTDYSTGTQYTYGDTSGAWTSIQSNGGKVNGNAGAASGTDTSAPAITSTSNGNVVPFDGTHRSDSAATTPNAGGWVPDPTTLCTATATQTTYPGLPSGWIVDSCSGKIREPSAAPSTSQLASSTLSLAVSQAGYCSASGYDVVTAYNNQGFLVTHTVPVGISTGWDDRGFPVTKYPSNCPTSNVGFVAGAVLKPSSTDGFSAASVEVTTKSDNIMLPSATNGLVAPSAGAAQSGGRRRVQKWLAAFCTLVAAMLLAVLNFA